MSEPTPARSAARRRWFRPAPLEIAAGALIAPLFVWWGLARLAGVHGLAEVGDGQVAVLVDHARGTVQVSGAPGMRPFVPWVQEVFTLDKQPIEFRFEGNEKGTFNRWPRLFVRAHDGSSFWFDSFTLQYALIPAAAERVLHDSGARDAYKERLVNAYARSVLRDEFGYFSCEEIVRPENLRAATDEARRRLNEYLKPHGVEVLEVAVAKPRFDPLYEKAIERRKVGNQEIEHLRAQIEKLEQERHQRIARALEEKESELLVRRGNLARDRLAAEQEAIKVRNAADVFALQKRSEAQTFAEKRAAEAETLVAKYTLEADGLRAHADALAAQGEDTVRAALIERLSSIEFNIQPFVQPQATLGPVVANP
ncbi:MAG: hypothetical protein HZA52_21135 [Planctomycetes bacterium]|nr:hypothetical protein [Planctomycetota bacterium]